MNVGFYPPQMNTTFKKGPEAGHLVVVDEGGQVRENLLVHISQPTIPSYRPGCGATTTMVNLAWVTPDAGALAQSKRKAEIHHEKNT